jgi:hypothetical protein
VHNVIPVNRYLAQLVIQTTVNSFHESSSANLDFIYR